MILRLSLMFLFTAGSLFGASDNTLPDYLRAKPKPAPKRTKPKTPSSITKKMPNPRPPRTADPKALEAVNAYLKATAPDNAYSGIVDRYEQFKVLRHSPTNITTAVFTRYMKRPYKIREQWKLDVKFGDENTLNVLQVFNGKQGWTKMMNYVDEIKGKSLHQLMHNKFIDDFFMHWKQDGYSLVYRGDGTVNDEACDVVDVYHATGTQRLRFFFSKKSHLKLKKQWDEKTRTGEAKSELFFSEWRKVKDLKNPGKWIHYPFKQETYQNGNLTMEREHLNIKLNSGLGDELFERPEGETYSAEKIKKQLTEKQKEGKEDEKEKLPWVQRKKRNTDKEDSSSEETTKTPEEAKEQ